MTVIRKATPADLTAMRSIIQSVIATGDTLPFTESMDHQTFQSHWFGAHTSYVAMDGSSLVGMYKFGANYPDLGSHVASATYMVSPGAQGRGIGRILVEHSLAQARIEGFMAMQFNYVVSTNVPAIALYKKLGFAIVGTLPKAFRHQRLGLVDAHIMYQFLQSPDIHQICSEKPRPSGRGVKGTDSEGVDFRVSNKEPASSVRIKQE